MGRATVRRLLAAGAVVTLAAGCGSYTDTSSAAGVDELVIPTPTPDPDDFVATIDNPWLPLAPDSSWTYDAEGATPGRLVVSVTDGPTVAGVPTTAVRGVLSPSGDGDFLTWLDYYAQDDDGNVWWFGHEGEWRAGDDGAEAGIAMLAKPRVGDGYAETGADGEPGQHSRITDLGDQLVIETTTPSYDDVESRYERGLGLVLREGGDLQLELVEYDGPGLP